MNGQTTSECIADRLLEMGFTPDQIVHDAGVQMLVKQMWAFPGSTMVLIKYGKRYRGAVIRDFPFEHYAKAGVGA